MLYSIWQFLSRIDWNKAGGDSFVELWAGLNLAFFAWDKYQEALSWPRRKCEQIIEVTTCNILDKPQQVRIVALFARWSKLPASILSWLCRICRWLAILAFVVGVYMLYTERYSPWDWILILPTLTYLFISAAFLVVFFIITGFVGWCFGQIPTEAQIAREIQNAADTTTKKDGS